MSYNLDNFGIPFLPGYNFRDGKKSDFHRPQTLMYRNGFLVPRHLSVGIGRETHLSSQLTQQNLLELSDIPDLTYGPEQHKTTQETFVPAFVALDEKVLCYYGYFVEQVQYSPEGESRVHPVVIFYHLVDDSMSISEAAGPLRKRLRRHRFPKNARGDHYSWKDLNVGVDLHVYGFTYRITNCNAFTKEFMESEGLEVNHPEPTPLDSSVLNTHTHTHTHTHTPTHPAALQ